MVRIRKPKERNKYEVKRVGVIIILEIICMLEIMTRNFLCQKKKEAFDILIAQQKLGPFSFRICKLQCTKWYTMPL